MRLRPLLFLFLVVATGRASATDGDRVEGEFVWRHKMITKLSVAEKLITVRGVWTRGGNARNCPAWMKKPQILWPREGTLSWSWTWENKEPPPEDSAVLMHNEKSTRLPYHRDEVGPKNFPMMPVVCVDEGSRRLFVDQLAFSWKNGWVPSELIKSRERYSDGKETTTLAKPQFNVGGLHAWTVPWDPKNPAAKQTVDPGLFDERGDKKADPEPVYDESNDATNERELTFAFFLKPKKLEAIPNQRREVERGQEVELDGDDSTGDPVTYSWSFSKAECAMGATTMAGSRISYVALCAHDAELTVTKNDEKSRRTLRVTVKPRSWKTKAEVLPTIHEANVDGLDLGKPEWNWEAGEPVIRLAHGINVCGATKRDGKACRVDDHTLHPPPARFGSWKDVGYEVETVTAPGTPFDGKAWVKKWSMEVASQPILNSNILPGSAFYEHNRAKGRPIADLIKATELHEGSGGVLNGVKILGHGGEALDELAHNDPAKEVEAMVASDPEKLVELVDAKIGATEYALCHRTTDPLGGVDKPPYEEEFLALDPRKNRWIPAVMKAGGSNVIGKTKASCKRR